MPEGSAQNPYYPPVDHPRSFYDKPVPDFAAVTVSRTFADGRKRFNRTNDIAPQRWKFTARFDLRNADEAAYFQIYVEHYLDNGLDGRFTFTQKRGVAVNNCRYEAFEATHTANESWIQTVNVTIACDSYVGSVANLFENPFNFGVFYENSELPPAVPSGLTVFAISASTPAVRGEWSESMAFGGRTVAGYRVKVDGGAVYPTDGSLITNLFYEVGSLSAFANHSLQVAAVDSGGYQSAWSSAKSATTGAGQGGADVTPPTGLAFLATSGIASTSAKINWKAATDPSGVGGYDLQIADDSGFTNIVQSFAGLTGTSKIVSALTVGTTYYVRIRAFDTVTPPNVMPTWVVGDPFTTLALPVNNPPQAQNIVITGTKAVNSTLVASYVYFDPDTPADTEGATVYQWYRADDAAGTNRTAISGATGTTSAGASVKPQHTLTLADAGKNITIGILAKATSGVLVAAQESFAAYTSVISNFTPAAPTNPVTDDSSDTFQFTITPGIPILNTDNSPNYEISTSGANGAYSDITVYGTGTTGNSYTVHVGNGNFPGSATPGQGTVAVRVKAIPGRNQSVMPLTNIVDFTATVSGGTAGQGGVLTNDFGQILTDEFGQTLTD